MLRVQDHHAILLVDMIATSCWPSPYVEIRDNFLLNISRVSGLFLDLQNIILYMTPSLVLNSNDVNLYVKNIILPLVNNYLYMNTCNDYQKY
jgi:hypothetical protein